VINRRKFLETTIAAAAAAQARPLFAAESRGIQGANDRIRVGIIGCGNRGNQVATDWMKHKDTVFIAAAEVAKDRLDSTAARLGKTQGNTVETYEDYRRVLERKDVDAVLIATPDHWHSPMTIEAISAGKDVYCEKPVSNEIEPAYKMLEAVRKSNRIVQIGTQQRSWHHFQEAAKLFHEGYVGQSVNHCQMCPPGGGGGGGGQQQQQPQGAQPIPEGFNWEMFQGPAKRKPFVPGRRNWRGWYDYGGGNLTDWGVHLTDVMNWFMKTDNKAPLLTSASAQYVRLPRDPERVPDTYAVTWQFENFVATLSNAMVPGLEDPRDRYGNYFFGNRGVLLVNRIGYEVLPYVGAAAGRGGGGGRGQDPNAPPPPPPLEPKKFKDPSGNMSEVAESSFGSATHRHVRNFLDCVKSRQQPVCHIEVGFHATLPTLLAIVSVKEGRTVKWDGKSAKTT
jgi:predicted dehydrogenase